MTDDEVTAVSMTDDEVTAVAHVARNPRCLPGFEPTLRGFAKRASVDVRVLPARWLRTALTQLGESGVQACSLPNHAYMGLDSPAKVRANNRPVSRSCYLISA